MIPASIHPYNLNRGSGGFGCSTAFLASAVTLPSEALTVPGLGDGVACCAYAEPEKDPYAANAMTPAKATRLNDFNLFKYFIFWQDPAKVKEC
jgi:hypothetical protein